MNPVLNRTGVETLIFNNGYELGFAEDDPSYVCRQCTRFDNAFDNMFKVYLTIYGSSSSHIHTIHEEAGSSSHGKNETIRMYNLWKTRRGLNSFTSF